jgi:hypothetical protein
MVNRHRAVASAPIDARAQIIDVISAVTLHVDLLEFDVVKSMYAPDATLTYKTFKTLFGADGLPVPAVQFWDQVIKFLPGFDRSFHQITNFDIHVEGDAALSRSMVSACHRLDDELWEQGGLYEHDLVKLSVGWRIRHHTYTQYWERGRDLSREAGERLSARTTD